jgi:hypothetical protein
VAQIRLVTPIRDDLLTGLSALPIWMQDFIREVIGSQWPGRAGMTA